MKIRDHRPKIIGAMRKKPNCEADTVGQTADWHQRIFDGTCNGVNADKRKRKWKLRGLRSTQCSQPGTYTVNGKWYCRQHAARIALDDQAQRTGT